jgi:C-terminal processing protease CtpA/Prc
MGNLRCAAFVVLASAIFAAPAHAAGRSAPSSAVERAAGVRVEEVVPTGAAEGAGIRAGDRIVAIDGKAIGSYADLDAEVSASGGRRLIIDIDRRGARIRVRAAPRGMIAPDRFSVLQGARVLGVGHWELRFAPGDDLGETTIPAVNGPP